MQFRFQRLLTVLSCSIAFLRVGTAGPIVVLDQSVLGPAPYAAKTVGSGLNFPYGMAATSNGSLLFGQSTPATQFGIEGGPSTGSVWLLPKQADGSFGAPQQVVGNLAGPVTNVRTSPNGLVVVDSGAASGRTMTIYDSSFQLKGTLSFNYPNQGWWHQTGMSLVSPQPGGVDRIFFIVGSETDGTKTTDTVATSGLFSSTLNGDSIYSVDVKLNGGALQVLSSPVQIATGMRNPFGLTLDGAGNLIVGDNGIDGAHVVNQQGADTLYSLSAGQLGSTVFDLGFPGSYTDFATGLRVNGNSNAIQPLTAFLPILSQGTLQYGEGLAGMAYAAPGSMPFVGALGGEFIGFHGVKDTSGAANPHNEVVYYDFQSGTYTPIVDSGSAGVGHFDTVLVSGHSLFLADFSTTGLDVGTGAILQFDFAVPEPATMGLVGLGLVAAAALRRRRAAQA